MSRYHHNKVTHELEPIAGYGSRVATSVDGKTLTVHSSLLNIDGYNYGSGDIGTAIQMMATIESGMVASKNYSAGECFVYNAILYVVTEDVSDGDAFVIGENCSLASNLSEMIRNTNKVTVKEISTTDWDEDTTSQVGVTLYKKSVTLNNVYTDIPTVSIGSSSTLPSVSEQEAYDLLKYITVDNAIPCLYLYASDVPSNAFYINVKGVD